MVRPTRNSTLLVLCQLYANWNATTPEEEAVEDCLRRLVDDELRALYPHAFELSEGLSKASEVEILRDSWSWN